MKVLEKVGPLESVDFSARQYGFTLVELMVAMAIGLVIILGATKIFLITKASYSQVQNLGDQQNALSFSVDMLSRDIRRAAFVSQGGISRKDDSRLYLMFESDNSDNPEYCRGRVVEYYLKKTPYDNEESYSLYMRSSRALRKEGESVDCRNNGKRPYDMQTSVLLSGLAKNGLEVISQPREGYWKIRVTLLGAVAEAGRGDKKVVFSVMNRAAAFGKGLMDNLSGFDKDTDKRVYGKECYNGNNEYKEKWCAI